MSTNVEIDEHVVNTLKIVNFCYDINEKSIFSSVL